MAEIIDTDGNVGPGLAEYLTHIGVSSAEAEYHIVSIIGAQSSGKSTLLNNLFGTGFATMNETTGRQQTTKGIHAAYSDPLLVFDVEGSDSRERGDADALFERKAALFALALSEVVIVNMWQNDMGRYNASSIPLLKTVFEVNLQLFAVNKDTKCHLLFVIRDSTSDATVIEGQCRKDLDMIWNQLTLPTNLSNRPFDDFFVFHFVPLPHYRLKRAEFDVSAQELSARFMDPNSENYLFRKKRGNVIPGDGLYQYILNVWESITENRELNLPSQRRTVSSFRCDEFVSDVLVDFQKRVDDEIDAPIKDGMMPEFGKICNEIVKRCVMEYNGKSEKYVFDVVEEKRDMLKDKMGATLREHFNAFCNSRMSAERERFDELIDSGDKFIESEGWFQRLSKAKENALTAILETISSATVDGYNWAFDFSDFEPYMTDALNKRLDEKIKELEDTVYSTHVTEYTDSVDDVIRRAENVMWETVRRMMKQMSQRCDEEVQTRLDLNVGNRRSTGVIGRKINQLTATRALKVSDFVPRKMNERFDAVFLRDSSGKTREWKNDRDDIPRLLELGRDAGLSVLTMFTMCQLREKDESIPPNDCLTQRLIRSNRVESIEQSFTEYIEKQYIEAIRIRESNRIHIHVPWPMRIAFVVFGYDKLIMAIRHPWWAVLTLSILGCLWFLYSRHYFDAGIQYALKAMVHVIALVVKFIRHGQAPRKRKAKPKKKRVHTQNNSAPPAGDVPVADDVDIPVCISSSVSELSDEESPPEPLVSAHRELRRVRSSSVWSHDDSLANPKARTGVKSGRKHVRESIKPMTAAVWPVDD